jgi:hypothetical protein
VTQAERTSSARRDRGTPYEAVARARKASRLCTVLVGAIDATPGFPLSPANIHLICASDTTAQFRRDFEELAGVRPGSAITWAVVEGLLGEHYFGRPAEVVDLFDHPRRGRADRARPTGPAPALSSHGR